LGSLDSRAPQTVASDRGDENLAKRRLFARFSSGGGAALAALALTLVAFALRATNLGQSWDIFVDEISYLRLSQSVAASLKVALYGDAFYLHPPLFFFLEGLYVWLVDPAGQLIDQIYAVRYLNAGLAGLSAAAVFGIGRKLGGWPVGLAGAVVFALDPFVIKMNSRNYLETSAMLWVMLAYYVLAPALATVDGSKRERVAVWRVLLAGGLFGLALLTKDMTAFLTLLPLGVCFVLGWALPRWQTFVAGVTTVLVYAPYPLTVWAIGDWQEFSYEKSRGALRLAGIFHETGFNQKGGPSFLRAILQNLDEFVTTYTLLGSGGFSILVIFFLGRNNPLRRLFLAWAASTYMLLAYIVLQGSLEEQFFYYLIAPAILATVVAAGLLIRLEVLGVWFHRLSLAVATLVCVAFVLWSGYVWYEIHSTPDNAYERVIDYLQDEVPKNARVGVTAETAQFLVEGESGLYGSVEELREDDAEYVVMSSYLLEEGYGESSPGFYGYVRRHGEVVYGFKGRSFGFTGLYRLPKEEQKEQGQAMDTAFVHRATGENSRGDYTYLSDPSIDGDPDAVVLVWPTTDRGIVGDGSYDHNVGVWYEPQARKWAIFNQDRAPVPDGTTFQVVIPGGPEKFVHRAEPENITENSTYLDDPLVNGEPEAILSVTQNWNPGGGGGTYNDHPVAVRYNAGREKWAIYNTDGSAMPEGAAFNVAVSGGRSDREQQRR
jgi:hypothetical protein